MTTLDGTAMTVSVEAQPAGCDAGTLVGQTRGLRGEVREVQVTIGTEDPSGGAPFRYEGTLTGNTMQGSVMQRAFGDVGAFEGTWTANRR